MRVKLTKTIPRWQIDLIYQVSCTSVDHIDPGRGVLPCATLVPGALANLAPSALTSLATDPGRNLERRSRVLLATAAQPHPMRANGRSAWPRHAAQLRRGSVASWRRRFGPRSPGEHQPSKRSAGWVAARPASPAEAPLFFFFCLLPFCSLSRWSY
jgi:hypothetical protein